MSRSRDWKRHPAAFQEIVKELDRDPDTPVEVVVETLGQASSMRLDFNMFKLGCIDAGFAEESPPWSEDGLPFRFLDQIEVLVRDKPPRVIIGLKDHGSTAKAIADALEQRRKGREDGNP